VTRPILALFLALAACAVDAGATICTTDGDPLVDAAPEACPLGPPHEPSGCAWPMSLEYSKSSWICDCVTADDCPLRVEEALSCGACVENLRCGVGGDLLLTACAGPCPL
jgi:hypothetical protein